MGYTKSESNDGVKRTICFNQEKFTGMFCLIQLYMKSNEMKFSIIFPTL